MRCLIILVSTLILGVTSCTKIGRNITIKGKVINPLTNVTYEGIKVQLVKSQSLSLPGGFTEKSLATTERSDDVETSFVVYPNPNSGTFNVKIDFTDFDGGTLEIYNLQGQLVDEFYVKDNSSIALDDTFESGTLLFARLRNEYKYFGSSKILIK